MKTKITLSLIAIAAVLLISCIISVMEYGRMSSYVSGLVADDISSINTARKLAALTSEYNLQILEVVGDEQSVQVPEFDNDVYMSYCDSLRTSLASKSIAPLADSLLYAYSAYMLTTLELHSVMLSDFIDSRAWYFDRLQPRYVYLNKKIDALTEAIHRDLQSNSQDFDQGFYRSIIPGIVTVGVGILLVLLLLFFIMSYYVSPLYNMLSGLEAYRSHDKKYNVVFEGDDQLRQLNDSIKELSDENLELRRRIAALKKDKDSQ